MSEKQSGDWVSDAALKIGRAIKFPSGVIGKTSFVFVVFLILCIVGAYFSHEQAISIIWIASVLLLIFLVMAFAYAAKFPAYAMSEGQILIDVLQIQMGAKNPTVIDNRAEVVAPPPTLIGGSADG
jgi:hypothetical protein